jgi:lipopolysaccharide export system permease protein
LNSPGPIHRRPGGTIYRLVGLELWIPTFFTLIALSLMLLTQDLLGFAELVINRGLGAATVAWIAFYQTVPVVAQVLPFSVLVGCLIGLGRMGTDRELLILEASGISSPRLMWPVALFAALVSLLAFGLSLYAAPWSSRTLDDSLIRIARQTPSATLQSGVVHRFGDLKLEAREVSSDGQELREVLAWLPEIGETVFANRGRVTPDPDGAMVELEDGTIILNPRKRQRQINFGRLVVWLPPEGSAVKRDVVDGLEGLSIAELQEVSLKSRSAPKGVALKAAMEIQRRFALPTATIVFGLLAVPLFFSRAHFSRAGGAVLGILCTLAYYGLLQLGFSLAQAESIPAALGAWLPNLVLGTIAVLMAFRLTRVSSFGRHEDRPIQPESQGLTGFMTRTAKPRRWALQIYVSERFLEMVALCFAVLLVGYFIVDLLERLDFVEAGLTDFMRLYWARLPTLASRVIPMALLLATALTVSLLGAHGELTGMRACGIPAPRALAPILVICVLIAPAYFLLNNLLLPRSTAQYHKVKAEIIQKRFHKMGLRAGVWYRVGQRVYEADEFDSRAGTARNIIVYELGEGGRPISRVDAREAHHIGSGVWRLLDPVRAELQEGVMRKVAAGPFAALGEGRRVRVNTNHLSTAALAKQIEEVEASGYDSTAFRVDYFVKWAAPLGCIVLPALALFFAIGGPPFPSSSLTVSLSVIVAVSFVLLTGVGASLGYGGVVTPFIAGWGPPGLFAALALLAGLRLRNLGRH